MQANYGRSGVPVDVSFFLDNDTEEWMADNVERHQKPTKFKRDRNFPTRQEKKWRNHSQNTQVY